MVQGIKQLSAKLELEPLGSDEVLLDADIPVVYSRSIQDVPARIAKIPGRRQREAARIELSHAVTAEITGERRARTVAKPVRPLAGVGADGLVGSGYLKGRSGLERADGGDRPAAGSGIYQPGNARSEPAPAAEGQVVDQARHGAMAGVKGSHGFFAAPATGNLGVVAFGAIVYRF